MKPFLLFALSTLLHINAFAGDNNITLSDGWIRQLPPVVPMRAGYFTLHNNHDQAAEVVSISSPDFDRVEMHKTEMLNGVMKMGELKQLIIPAKGQLTLEPGGIHLMMFKPSESIKLDYRASITVNFRQLAPQTFHLIVKK